MENIKMSFVSLQRILNISCRAGEISEFEKNTLRYLISQCNDEQIAFILSKYGDHLNFIKNK